MFKTLRAHISGRKVRARKQLSPVVLQKPEGVMSTSFIPNGSERELIEHYFHKGFRYKEIVLLLEKYHNISMNVRTLKRRLSAYDLKRRNEFDANDVQFIKDLIIFLGFGLKSPLLASSRSA